MNNVHSLSISIPNVNYNAASPDGHAKYVVQHAAEGGHVVHQNHQHYQHNQHHQKSISTDALNLMTENKNESFQTPIGHGISQRIDRLHSQIWACEEICRERERKNGELVRDVIHHPSSSSSPSNKELENLRHDHQEATQENHVLRQALQSLRDVAVYEINLRKELEVEVQRLTTRLQGSNRRKSYHTKRLSRNKKRDNNSGRPMVQRRLQLDQTMHYEIPHRERVESRGRQQNGQQQQQQQQQPVLLRHRR